MRMHEVVVHCLIHMGGQLLAQSLLQLHLLVFWNGLVKFLILLVHVCDPHTPNIS